MEVEIGAMWTQVKECHQPPETGSGKEWVFLLENPVGLWLYQHLDFRLVKQIFGFQASRTVRE